MPAALVGVISDTHGLVRPEALIALAGCVRILHAGDVGDPAVLAALARLAPLTAVRGNNDRGPWARGLPASATLLVRERRVFVVHERTAVPADVDAAVVITGHSHRPAIETRDGRLFVNPGSAGPRRFALPVTVARLTFRAGRVDAEIVPLAIATPAAARRRARA